MRSKRRGGTFIFSFAVPSVYPHEAPKVKCLTKVRETKNLRMKSASELLPTDVVCYSFPGISPKHRLRRKRMLEYTARRLETCLKHQLSSLRPSVPLSRSQPRRSPQPRCCKSAKGQSTDLRDKCKKKHAGRIHRLTIFPPVFVIEARVIGSPFLISNVSFY